jgi:hypothetical protein
MRAAGRRIITALWRILVQFSELIGQEVGVLIPRIDKVKIFHVKILGVEGGGIWISSQAAASVLLQVFQIQTAPKEFVFFLPYHEMTLAMVEAHGTTVDVNER